MFGIYGQKDFVENIYPVRMKVVVSERVEKLVLLSDQFVVESRKLEMFRNQRFGFDCNCVAGSAHLEKIVKRRLVKANPICLKTISDFGLL